MKCSKLCCAVIKGFVAINLKHLNQISVLVLQHYETLSQNTTFSTKPIPFIILLPSYTFFKGNKKYIYVVFGPLKISSMK